MMPRRWTWERVYDLTHAEGSLIHEKYNTTTVYVWTVTQKGERKLLESLREFLKPTAPTVRIRPVPSKPTIDEIVTSRKAEVVAIAKKICRYKDTEKMKKQCKPYEEIF